MACLFGKWKTYPELTTGFDEFADAYGVTTKTFVKRNYWSHGEKFVAEIRTTHQQNIYKLEISREGDTWKQAFHFGVEPGPSLVNTFKSGEPFIFLGLNGKTRNKSTVTVHDDKFTARLGVEQKDGTFKELDTITEREGEMLKITQIFKSTVKITKMKRI